MIKALIENEALMTVCGWIGALAVASCAVMIVYFAFDSLRNVIHVLRWTYKYEHRFDKPPTAKCYCKDCECHSVKSGECSNVTWADRYTPDNGFCYEAKPRKKDIDNG